MFQAKSIMICFFKYLSNKLCDNYDNFISWMDFLDWPTIDCDKERICHLAWLLNYRRILNEERFDNFAKCSNGTSVRELHFEGFNHC